MMEQKTCTLCHTVFECGANDTMQPCWCYELPNVISPVGTTDCLCPTCLAKKIKEMKEQKE